MDKTDSQIMQNTSRFMLLMCVYMFDPIAAFHISKLSTHIVIAHRLFANLVSTLIL